MKSMTIIASIIVSLSFTAQAVQFECVGPQKTGLRGNLDQNNGKIEITSASLDWRSKVVQFTRMPRRNESQYKFSKFIGSTLFYNFTFSLPKTIVSKQSDKNFTAYIGWFREGVDGKEDIRIDCGVIDSNPTMTNLYRTYRNLFDYDDLSTTEKKIVISIDSPDKLPKNILKKLKDMGFTITIEDSVVHTGNEHLISFSSSDDFDYSFVVADGDQVFGYVFSITTCNQEECYGFEALYLDAFGNILYNTL